MKDTVVINRLNQLLLERKEEYKIFGATEEDKQKDIEINNKIKDLELE